jgi:uncharacterized SAM-binding protein YcdF (DUF218 family)
MFFARKMLEALLSPLMLVFAGLALGALLRRRPRAEVARAGRWVFALSLVTLAALGFGIPFDLVAKSIEDRYPALTDSTRLAGVRWVIVLGGEVKLRSDLSVSAYPGQASIYRIVEGVRVHRLVPDARMIFTGYADGAALSSATAGANLARALGVDPAHIVEEPRPRTTQDEAAYVRQRVGTDSIVLVTSALHMPRAMLLFEQQGMHPIAAPTGYRADPPHGSSAWYVPLGRRIGLAEDVIHELVGTFVARRRPPT